jgi:hypothetical protein
MQDLTPLGTSRGLFLLDWVASESQELGVRRRGGGIPVDMASRVFWDGVALSYAYFFLKNESRGPVLDLRIVF